MTPAPKSARLPLHHDRTSRRTRAAWLILLACTVLLYPAARGAEALVERVSKIAAEVRDLESRYSQEADEAQRCATLRAVLEKAPWLEQIGGLQEARENLLLALVRLEALNQRAPLRYGYGPVRDGSGQVELTARPPQSGELPEALRGFEKRLRYFRVLNASRLELEPSGGAWVEFQDRQGESRRAEGLRGEALPAELRTLAALFDLPARLAPRSEAQVLLLIPESKDGVCALGIELREPGNAEGLPLAVRILFPEVSNPAAWMRAKTEAARLALEVKMEVSRKRPDEEKAPPAVKPPPAPAKPEEKIPVELGVVERAGAEEKIQIRLNAAQSVVANEILRVRKDGQWRGLVKIPAETTFPPEKTVFWAVIVEGGREQIIDGTLHRKD